VSLSFFWVSFSHLLVLRIFYFITID